MATETIAGPYRTIMETETKPAPPAQTMTVKVTVAAAPVTVTAAAPPPAAAAGSVENGNYLVGTEIKPGNYHCSAGDASDVFWETNSSTNEIVDNGFGLIAFVSSDAYSVTLEHCDGSWAKIS